MRRALLIAFCLARAAWAFSPAAPNGECGAERFDPTAGESYDAFYRRAQRDQCWKEWLIVVYMAADNSLSPYSYRDLWEMQAAGSAASSSASLDTVVFHDSDREDGFRYYHIAPRAHQRDYRLDLPAFIQARGIEELAPAQQEEAFLSEQGPSLIVSPVVETRPEGNSADPKSIADFLQWALTRYPSRRVLFIGWSHGVGFAAPETATPVSFSFALDTQQRDYLPVGAVTAAVREAQQAWRGGEAFDIVGSDACLNQQVEFGFEWLGLTQYVFGSSTIVQNKGFNYRTLLDWFGQHARSSSAELAQRIPALYGDSVSTHAGGKYSSYADPNATMATWTMAELPALKAAWEELAQVLSEHLLSAPDAIARTTRAAELQRVFLRSQRLGGTSNDLYGLLQQIRLWSQAETSGDLVYRQRVQAAVDRADGALERSVLARYLGTAYQQGLVPESKAVAIWLPASAREYRQLFPLFSRSRFYQGAAPGTLSHWGDLVERIFAR